MQQLAIAGLIKIELPDSTVIRLAEGGAVRWGAEDFLPRHALYGAVAGFEALSEGVGSEVPAAQITLDLPGTAAAADLVQPGAQQARVRVWVARYIRATSTVTGTPRLAFDGFLDQARLTRGPNRFQLAISVVSLLERLFEQNIGNWLSPTFHKSVWPGETGEDEATGLILQDAWGVESPRTGTGAWLGGFVSGVRNSVQMV